MTNFLQNFKKHLANIPGWRTNRKIVVFESDDWGSIRMVNKASFDKLIQLGIRVDHSKYDSLDSLERKEDLEALFNVLQNNRDHNSQTPIFTFNTVLGNPDFEQIRQIHFAHFVHQSLFDSYQNYYGQNLKEVWTNAIQAGLMKPQFHAREHLNTGLWMRDLRANHKETRLAFDHRFYGLKTQTSSKVQKHYLMAYHPDTDEEFAAMVQIVKNGLNMFHESFGFSSDTFVACNYVWPKALENELKPLGIDFLQGQCGQLAPVPGKNKRNVLYHYTGQRNRTGQTYLVRNVIFEPYLDQSADWVGRALKEIEIAFRWRKPAIISTHRINYVGNMDEDHRDASLKKLDDLLKQIITLWPDVEFTSSDQLGKIISNRC